MEKNKPLEGSGLRKGVVVFDGSGNAGYFDGEHKALYTGNKNVVEKYLCDLSGRSGMPQLTESPGTRIAGKADRKSREKKMQAATYVLDMAPDIAALVAVMPFEYGAEKKSEYALARFILAMAAYTGIYVLSKKLGKEAKKMGEMPSVFRAEDGKYRPSTYEELTTAFPKKKFRLEDIIAPISVPYLS